MDAVKVFIGYIIFATQTYGSHLAPGVRRVFGDMPSG